MADILPLPRLGDMFVDARGEDRTMRVSLHPDRGLIVVSLWSGATCRASFRLPLDEAARLSQVLDSVVASTAAAADIAVTDPAAAPAGGGAAAAGDLPLAS
jgi:hypothetical protein